MIPSIEEVHGALVELYRESIGALKGRQLYSFPKSKFVLDGATFRTEEEDEYAWDLLVEEGAEVLSRLDSFATVRQWLEADPAPSKHLGQMVGIDDSRHGVSVLNCVSSFLAELYEDAGGLNFDEEEARAKAPEFTSFFCRDTIEFECTAILENFSCNRDRVELGEGLVIERWDAERRADLLELMETSLSLHGLDALIRQSEFVLRLKTQESKVIHDEGDNTSGGTGSSRRVHERFSSACVALSIYGKARIRYHDVSRVATSWVPAGRSFHPSSSGGDPLIAGQTREFQDDEVEGFLAFWPRFLRCSTSLRVGIRWLDHLLCSTGSTEDHLIRAAIVLESTLLHKEKSELRYRLRLRGARLLVERDRKRTYTVLRLLYDFRSEVVHEGGRLPEKIRVQGRDLYRAEFVDEIVAICRDTVVRLIDLESQGDSLPKVLADLDEQALLGSSGPDDG